MSSSGGAYEPRYEQSHALVIGINKYLHTSPLAYATNDASAVAKALQEKFGFPAANVSLLLDAKATRANIMSRYMSFTDEAKVSPNDRLLVFFAGHGITRPGRREAGFLFPVDGKADDLATLVRWEDLTRNADLIPAKHILFLMDACYGGLAVRRRPIPPGSSRFLEDMLTRITRQVVTAGKADETVSDGDGTRPAHSLFTSNLLDALDGAAETTPGILTAMGVMSYVYDKVSNDPNSTQTPHFGFIDGDGDFIFKMPEISAGGAKSENTFVKTPQIIEADEPVPMSIGGQVKTLLPNATDRIRLDDLVVRSTNDTLARISARNYPAEVPAGKQLEGVFVDYVNRYEGDVKNLQAILIQLCRWAEGPQVRLIKTLAESLGANPETRGGFEVLTRLDWYPVTLIMYAGGISALAADRFDTLHACMMTPVNDSLTRRDEPAPLFLPAAAAMTRNWDAFKWLPNMAQKYAPRSEHMFTVLQSVVEDELFLGRKYEEHFDRFEIMLALAYSDMEIGTTNTFWGPPGRFAWRENSLGEMSGRPFTRFVNEARAQGDAWPALHAGFFKGSAGRFAQVAEEYAKVIAKLSWF